MSRRRRNPPRQLRRVRASCSESAPARGRVSPVGVLRTAPDSALVASMKCFMVSVFALMVGCAQREQAAAAPSGLSHAAADAPGALGTLSSRPIVGDNFTCTFTRGQTVELKGTTIVGSSGDNKMELTFSELGGDAPMVRGAQGTGKVIVSSNTEDMVVVMEQTGLGNVLVYTIFRKHGFAVAQRAYDLGGPVAHQLVGECKAPSATIQAEFWCQKVPEHTDVRACYRASHKHYLGDNAFPADGAVWCTYRDDVEYGPDHVTPRTLGPGEKRKRSAACLPTQRECERNREHIGEERKPGPCLEVRRAVELAE